MKMNIHLDSLCYFAMPNLDNEIPVFSSHRQALIDASHKLYSEDNPDLKHSNQGAWHSLHNLTILPSPKFTGLIKNYTHISAFPMTDKPLNQF